MTDDEIEDAIASAWDETHNHLDDWTSPTWAQLDPGERTLIRLGYRLALRRAD